MDFIVSRARLVSVFRATFPEELRSASSPSRRDEADLSRELTLDATKLLKFRGPLLQKAPTRSFFYEISGHLVEQGLLMRVETEGDRAK